MAENLKLEQMPTGAKLQYTCTPIGPLTIATARGVIEAAEVPGCSTIEMRDPNGAPLTIMLFLYDPETGSGMFNQMSAEMARHMGASLIHLANRLDGQEPVQ